MTSKFALKLLFSSILVVMVACTLWATSKQSMFDWSGLTAEPNRYWTIATMSDAYCGFVTFYAWVFYKEHRALPRVLWFVGIMALGNMAMAAYVLLQLFKLAPGEPAAHILTSRKSGEIGS